MIDELRIRDLGVIADALVPLGPGLTVLTGETGAGKTMIVTALGLLMGGRADAAVVRKGTESAVVEARVLVDPAGPAAARIREAGGDLDGDELVLSRTVPTSGRARAFAGGRSVPAQVLADIADELVAVHGQSDQLLLRSPARQRALLDRFALTLPATPPDVIDRYRAAYKAWRSAARAVEALDRDRAERERELADLDAGIALVESLDPQPGEDAALTREWERLAHGEELRLAAATAHDALAGDDDAVGAVGLFAAARAALEGVRDHDPDVAGLADRAAELAYLAADLATDLAGYTAGIDADPARLAEVEARRHDLRRLMRRHDDVDAALAWADVARARLAELAEAGDEAAVAAAEAAARAELDAAAAAVTAVRTEAAAVFARDVTSELRELALPQARLEVAVTAAEPGPDGADDVEIRLAAHAGADPMPVARAASGGELSRVMLGVEVVVGAADPVGTFVFDEVDSGVGGAAALGIGRRLARLGAGSQVLVVTHLAQVASYADHHLVVEKAADGSGVVSTVRRVTGAERRHEIARMLSGATDSRAALAHAQELLKTSAGEVAALRPVVEGAPRT